MENNYLQFMPDYSPMQMLKAGVFGGIYFNDAKWREGLPAPYLKLLTQVDESLWNLPKPDKSVNAWEVFAGSDQFTWEINGWMHLQDPRGWYQWYIHFYYGRRSEDDARQVSRWKSFKARHLAQFIGRRLGNPENQYPVSRQALLQWAIKTL